MSALTGPSSKGEKGKSKYQSLDINSIYNSSRSEASEAQATKNTLVRKHGMQQLGKVPPRRPTPANLPSLKSENSGNDPSISLVPTGGQGWVVKSGEPQQLAPTGGTGSNNSSPQPAVVAANQNVTPSPAPAVGAPSVPTQPSGPPPSHSQTTSHSHDKTWSSITGGSQASTLGVEHGPSFLAHQSPQFRQEFPSLSGEPGGAQAHPTPTYGPGPSLRPQTEPGSWSQGTHAKPSQTQANHNSIPTLFKSVVPSFLLSKDDSAPMFPDSLQKKSRSQSNHNENRMNNRMTGGGPPRPSLNNNQGGASGEVDNFIHSKPIIREEELSKMDELIRDPSWAANDDIDYNEQLSFSDGESVGDDDKEKENKLREKSKHIHTHSHQQQSIRDYEKKEDTEKSNRDKAFMSERDRNQQAWRVGNNTYSDFRNAPPRQLIPQGGRMDEDEVWKEKRRQTNENKMAAAEKAKQRKEEEEKRYEESRTKKNSKDLSDFHSTVPMPSVSEWDKEDRAKSSENFRQMIQIPLEPRSNMNRERDRDMRRDRDRDNQYNSRFTSKPPRFRKNEGGKAQHYGGGFEKNWSNHNSFGRRGGPDDSRDKDDDYRKDKHNDRPSPSDSTSDRFRGNLRDDRSIDSSKRIYYDNSHTDYNQSSFQSNRERDVEKELKKDFDFRMSDKDSSRDLDKDWESSKGDNDPRSFDDRMRRDNKPSNDNFTKQSNDHIEEKENEWRERPVRPESRDRPERLDNRERQDRDHRMDMRPDIRDLRNDPRFERQESRDSNRFDSRDFRSHDSRDNRYDHNRHDRNSRPDNLENKINRDRFDSRDKCPENQDSSLSDIRDRPSRPDSRDSRASRTSKDLSEKGFMDGDYSISESYMSEKMERLTFKEKDSRREPMQRSRDHHVHVPGPITQEKLVAYEHKHNQSQLEKSDSQEKENEDKKRKIESETVSQVWGDSREDKSCTHQESLSKPLEQLPRNEFSNDDNKLNKGDDIDKRKDNSGGMRDRRDDKNNSGGGRGNRNNRGAPRGGGYTSTSKYNSYSSDRPNWPNKDNRDNRQRQVSSRGQKHWNRSESEGSGDDATGESLKDDKKTDGRKQECSPKFGKWKENKDKRDEKKDMKSIGSESDKDRSKGDKKTSGGVNETGRKGDGGFAPRGEPSRRGRGGGGGGMRGQSRVGMGPTLYGPPGSKPFSSSGSQPHQSSIDSQDKSSIQQSGQSNKGPRKGPGIRSQDENWDTTSETSDGSDAKKSNKNRNKNDKKPRGTIGDKRSIVNTSSVHLNGRPDSKPDDNINEKKSKDDFENTGYSNNGFQEVKSKKNGRESRGGPGSASIITNQGNIGPKDETKRSQSKGNNKEKPLSSVGGGGVKSQQQKSFTREFVNQKPPRMQKLENNRKFQQQQVSSTQDVSDMNKINQSVSPLFPLTRSNADVSSNSCPPPPPAHNAWNKPLNPSLRTTPPLSSTLTQLSAAPAQITTDKTNVEELGQSINTAPASSPTTDKAISKISREVEKSMMEGPPVNTIIFENTNFKRDPGDIGMKQRYPIKQPGRTPLDKTRERKMEDDLSESNHTMGLGAFKSASELQASEGKPQDNMPMTFGKNEDNADMKLDFAFDTDLSQLSDDKSNQSMHVGQSSAADLNQKIASVKKVWDTAPASMSGHTDENPTSSFTQGFTSDKSLESSAPSHHNDHNDFNSPDSVYGSGQLSSSGGYAAASSSMMKQDTIVSNANSMCKTNMFQVTQQPQQVTVMPHPGSLSTPPPLPNVLSYQGYSSNLPAVPSPPNVLYNSQTAAGPQTEIYQTYSLNAGPLHASGTRSFDFPQSYNMSQNSTFQASMYMQSGPPNPQSVFQTAPNQFRIPPSPAALGQQMNSNPNQMLMSSSSSSVVSGTQVKSSQGSMQSSAIGSKTGGAPQTPAYASPSTQILLIEQPAVSFLHQGFHRPTTLQHSSSYFATNSALTGGPVSQSSSGLFNSSLLGSGGSANSGNLGSSSPFGVQPPTGSYSQQPPSSTQPPTHHQQPPYPNQHQMTANFRNPAGYAKTGHPETVKSSPSEQYPNMFPSNVQGSPKPRIGVVKPQPQPSPSPQPQHKFPYNNPQNVSQTNLGYSPNSSSNASRQQQIGQPQRYISPIQRPNYSQQQAQVQAAMLQQQQAQQAVQARHQQQHRLQQPHQGRPVQQHQPKQYYQQGGSMKLEGNESVKNEVEEKSSQDKTAKDESNSEQ